MFVRRPAVCVSLSSTNSKVYLTWWLDNRDWSTDDWANIFFFKIRPNYWFLKYFHVQKSRNPLPALGCPSNRPLWQWKFYGLDRYLTWMIHIFQTTVMLRMTLGLVWWCLAALYSHFHGYNWHGFPFNGREVVVTYSCRFSRKWKYLEMASGVWQLQLLTPPRTIHGLKAVLQNSRISWPRKFNHTGISALFPVWNHCESSVYI